MACFALIESLRPASCCTVEVVKGGFGLRVPGLASTETTTASPDASSAAASAVACDSVRTTTAFFSWPASSKSVPRASGAPSRRASRVAKPSAARPAGAATASTSQ